MIVTAAQLAELYGKDRRTVTNWLNSEPPCPSSLRGRERVFDTVAVAAWRAQRAAEAAVAAMQRQKPTDEAEARRRKLIAEATLAEIEVKEKEGDLLPMEMLEDTVGEMADRLRAVCINLPSNFALDLERVGVEPAAAQVVLEQIASDLTVALRAAVDDEPADLEVVA